MVSVIAIFHSEVYRLNSVTLQISMTYEIIIQLIITYLKTQSTGHVILPVGLRWKAAQQSFLSIQSMCLFACIYNLILT